MLAVNNGALTFNGTETTGGSAVAVSGGTMNINGLTTAGTVNVSAGTLNVNSTTTSGAVTVSSGTVNVNAQLATPSVTIGTGTMRLANSGSAGLSVGTLGSAFDTTTANPKNKGIQLTTTASNGGWGSSGASGGIWSDNTTYVYTGSINNSSASNVTWTFGENFDDSVKLVIDGTTILNDGTWNNPTLSSYTLTPGRHSFELRLGQGGGGVCGLMRQAGGPAPPLALVMIRWGRTPASSATTR